MSPSSWLTTARIPGSPARWARDGALFGTITCVVVPGCLVGIVGLPYVAAAGALGAVTGGLLGLAAPTLLDALRGQLPLALMLSLAPVFGAAWGGAVALVAGLAVDHPMWWLGLVSGGVAGAVQVGLWWFPYTFQSVRRGRTWPVLVGAAFTAPVVAWGTFIATMGAVFLAEGANMGL
jgi:hypothetical protein